MKPKLLDKNGVEIKIGSWVIMPEPGDDDIYFHGGWAARVIRVSIYDTLTVLEEDNFAHDIEPERVGVTEDVF